MMPPDIFVAEYDPVTSTLISLDAHWQDAAKLSLPVQLAGWILEPASLTARLKQHCQQFRVQLLNERAERLPAFLQPVLAGTVEAQLREVILWCDDKPCVYAQSWLPQHTINTLTPLAELGERPLGDYIFQQPGLIRGSINAAIFELSGSALTAFGAKGLSYARRSVFQLNGLPLLVAEVFLPAITQLQDKGE
uniref:Probable chorismate pyruvate-lyase n=1 Tax=Rheinheimera sp. BAL341 TaxID=1708203 RepID=A0A486XLM4_9GAMM